MRPLCTWTIRMHEDSVLNRVKSRCVDRTIAGTQYTARDFQLEVLERLAEMQEFATSLEESWEKKLEAVKEQRLLKFDSRALIAMGALALSIGAYVVQDARNSARQDSEIAAMQARVQRLEQIAATTTEARIRTEVQLGELRDGQNDIKAMLQTLDTASRKGSASK
jgi:soluble cytochrome b562